MFGVAAFGAAGIHLHREGESAASISCFIIALLVVVFYLTTRRRFGIHAQARLEAFLGAYGMIPSPDAHPVAERFAKFFLLGRAGRNSRAYHATHDEHLDFVALTFDGVYRNEVGLLPSLFALRRSNPSGRTSAHFILAKDTNVFVARLGHAKLQAIKLKDGLRVYFDPKHPQPTVDEIEKAKETLFNPSEDALVVYQRSVEHFEDSEVLYDADLDQIAPPKPSA